MGASAHPTQDTMRASTREVYATRSRIYRNHFSFVARMLITTRHVGFFEREFIEPGRARPPPDVFSDVISAKKAYLIDTRGNSVNRMMND